MASRYSIGLERVRCVPECTRVANEMIAKRFYITGRVQGVYFRASTRQQAERLGLRGWANNLPDGRVEVLAVGDDAAVAELGQWLHRGPPRAQVVSVEEMSVDAAQVLGIAGFRCG